MATIEPQPDEAAVGERRCPACDYDLRGHPPAGVRCPECGADVEHAAVLRAARRRTADSAAFAAAMFANLVISAASVFMLANGAVVCGIPLAAAIFVIGLLLAAYRTAGGSARGPVDAREREQESG